MECREQRVTWEEALKLYDQLRDMEQRYLLEDGIPTTVEISPDTVPLSIDDGAAKAFLRQFRSDPARSFFTLQLDACPPERFKIIVAGWANSPVTGRFVTILAQLDGIEPPTPEEYLAAQEFNASELNQLQRLAAVIEHLDPAVSGNDLRYFCNAIHHAIRLGVLTDCTAALENLTRTRFVIKISGTNHKIDERPGTVRDLACQILSLVALADLEVELSKHFSATEQGRLPAPVIYLRNIKASIIAGKIRSHYNPAEIATEDGAVALYDMATNTIEYGSHCDAATFLTKRLVKSGIRYPVQVALHELIHAAQDMHKGVFATDQPVMFWHHDEAVATFAEMFYVWMKDGPKAKMDFIPPYDTTVLVSSELISVARQLIGIEMPPDLPGTNYRGITLQQVEAYIAQMRAGKTITGVTIDKVADCHANTGAVIDILNLLANVRPWKVLAERAKTRAPFDQPISFAQLSQDRSAILYYTTKLHLPKDLNKWGTIVDRNIRLMQDYYQRMKSARSPESYAKIEYAFWSGGLAALVQSMLAYAIYRHAYDTTFNVRQFVTERLLPLAKLSYMMPQNPANLGVGAYQSK